jgi:hypothetical protein
MTAPPVGWRRIGRSWLGMKTWVKLWLFFLNGVFLAAFAFGYDPLAFWTLAAYGASGPLLVLMMRAQGGLTRLLGIAHLIPWVPLVAYLCGRLGTAALGPRLAPATDPGLFAYAVVLLAVVVVCLAFDVWDVVRWARGERFVLGSRAAYEAGASRHTLGDGLLDSQTAAGTSLRASHGEIRTR